MKIKLFLIVLVICAFLGYLHHQNALAELRTQNASILRNNIAALTESSEVSLQDIATFEWDHVYFFDCYKRSRDVDRALGFHWNGFCEEQFHEGMQIVFVRGRQVVCYCKGFEDENGFYIGYHYGEATFARTENIVLSYDAERPMDLMLKQEGWK